VTRTNGRGAWGEITAENRMKIKYGKEKQLPDKAIALRARETR